MAFTKKKETIAFASQKASWKRAYSTRTCCHAKQKLRAKKKQLLYAYSPSTRLAREVPKVLERLRLQLAIDKKGIKLFMWKYFLLYSFAVGEITNRGTLTINQTIHILGKYNKKIAEAQK